MTEPKKLPPLASVYKRPYGHFVCEANGDVLPHAEVLEAIRRCEMHDRLVEALEGILDSHLAQRLEADGPDLNGMGRAIGKSYLGTRLREARAILKENQ